MNRISGFRCFVWLLGMSSVLLVLNNAVAQAPVGEVVSLSGTPERLQGATISILQLGDTLLGTDAVRTDDTLELVLEMRDGSRLSIDRDTRVEIQEYLPGGQSAELGVIRGRLRSVVSDTFSRRRNAFRVRTSTAVAGVQGTDFLVEAYAASTRVTVYEGIVEVINADPAIRGSQQVNRLQTVLIRRGEAPPTPTDLQTSGQSGAPDFGSGGSRDRQFGNAPWTPGSTDIGGLDGGGLAPPPSIVVPPDPNLPR